jgi:uncharacterized protein YyaL (SSP411 family)
MANELAGALSPYLRQHADNPVDWRQWGPEPFAEAARRDVPVLVSIGYATCHWCHVMARESFSDPAIADYLGEHFVAIKVDREEHPEVDAGYLAAASAFTENLGWPLNVFVTPEGRAFFAGTYWPPEAMTGHPSFRQVLEGVADAWANRRDQVESNAADVAAAIRAQSALPPGPLPDTAALDRVVDLLARHEDTEFGGFGTAPKFPMAPVLGFLLERSLLEHGPAGQGRSRSVDGQAPDSEQRAPRQEAPAPTEALALAGRALAAMAASGLRDPIEGGFFRYATRRDWSEPHYERMLYDNAQLLRAYAVLAALSPEHAPRARQTAEGIVDFLLGVLRLPGASGAPGGFASAQNSESVVDGHLTEGDYYALDAAARARQTPPALDDKVLTGWNGLAIGALAQAGYLLERPDWVDAARESADSILASQLEGPGSLVRVTLGGRPSAAPATLEDYGLLADGLLHLAQATGEVRWAVTARELVDACLAEGVFTVPGGGDPTLAGLGIDPAADPTEGAYPSGTSALAASGARLYLLTGERRFRAASESAMESLAPAALRQPTGFGAALAVMSGLAAEPTQLVVVAEEAGGASGQGLVALARHWLRRGGVSAVVTNAQARAWADAGFGLFEGKTGERATAYLCREFVCRLPVTDPADLEQTLQLGDEAHEG